MEKKYNWPAKLKPHTKAKLDVLRGYIRNYLDVMVPPMRHSFKIAIVDAFSGGGLYDCGFSGSPLVFLEELDQFSIKRKIQSRADNFPDTQIECLFYANDTDPAALDCLNRAIQNWQLGVTGPSLHIWSPKRTNIELKFSWRITESQQSKASKPLVV